MDLSKTIFIQILQWAPKKTHLFCNKVHIRRSRSPKVDNFGTNRKCVCDFLLVRHCDYGPILHCFWDTATYWLKIAYFPTPLSFGAPAPYKLMFRLEFRAEVNHEETRVLQWRPHDRIVSRFDMIPAPLKSFDILALYKFDYYYYYYYYLTDRRSVRRTYLIVAIVQRSA